LKMLEIILVETPICFLHTDSTFQSHWLLLAINPSSVWRFERSKDKLTEYVLIDTLLSLESHYWLAFTIWITAKIFFIYGFHQSGTFINKPCVNCTKQAPASNFSIASQNEFHSMIGRLYYSFQTGTE
jgi:hypothetical protein